MTSRNDNILERNPNDQCNTAIGLIKGIANGNGFCSGVGPFTAANMLQLLGHYSRIPCDSETVRHLHKVHRLQGCTLANVQQHAQQVSCMPAPNVQLFPTGFCLCLCLCLSLCRAVPRSEVCLPPLCLCDACCTPVWSIACTCLSALP